MTLLARTTGGCFPLALGFAAGLALGFTALPEGARAPAGALAFALGVGLPCLGLLRRARRAPAVSGRLRLRVAALLALGTWRSTLEPPSSSPRPGPQLVSLQGVVDLPPLGLSESRDGQARHVTLFRLTTAGGAAIPVRCVGEVPFLRGGHGVSVRGKLLPPVSPRNPGDLAGRGASLLWVRHPGHIRQRAPPPGTRVAVILGGLREAAHAAIGHLFGSRIRGLVLSMLLGDRRLLSDDVSDALRHTGTYHLLAISGLHVGIVMFFVLRLPLPRRVATPIQLSLLAGFCLLTGAHPPVLRASLGFGIHRALQAAGRSPTALSTLGLTALLLLAASPHLLLDVGFQLSFLAVASILTWGARLGAGRASQPLLAAFIVSLSTAVATAPLSALYFQRVYPLGPFWNLLALPLSALALVAGGAVVLIGFVSPTVASPLAWALEQVLDFILDVLVAASWVPGSFLIVPPPGPLALAGAFAVLLLGLCPRGRVPRVAAGVLLLGVCAAAWLPPTCPEVTVLDVGDGDASVLRAPGWGYALLDAGSTGTDRHAGPTLQRRTVACGARALSLVLLGHSHDDHVRGFEGLARRHSVAALCLSPFGWRRPTGQRISRKAQDAGIPVLELARGAVVRLHGEPPIVLRVLHPSRGEELLGLERENDLSLAFTMAIGSARMLFLGDLEERGVARLLAETGCLRAQVLLAPHHGRRNRLWPVLLERVRPESVIFSGEGADWARRLAASLEREGIRVFATWRQGAIRIRWSPRAGWQPEYW